VPAVPSYPDSAWEAFESHGAEAFTLLLWLHSASPNGTIELSEREIAEAVHMDRNRVRYLLTKLDGDYLQKSPRFSPANSPVGTAIKLTDWSTYDETPSENSPRFSPANSPAKSQVHDKPQKSEGQYSPLYKELLKTKKQEEINRLFTEARDVLNHYLVAVRRGPSGKEVQEAIIPALLKHTKEQLKVSIDRYAKDTANDPGYRLGCTKFFLQEEYTSRLQSRPEDDPEYSARGKVQPMPEYVRLTLAAEAARKGKS
jgi:hypothetical protein